ncbi:Putative pectin lyase/virulence factor [Septoria linicola]|uniref:Pectin lyase/virulence factor n=1 Tax=Septoria linicola TaxID=215465 RepID=A0A9Q9EF16_9PEZI|nr:putative pectin lyase/virulence factor [Septoria linicola]USW47504.1 Putative pectin lyase/virulence factor [Septoria linicola]
MAKFSAIVLILLSLLSITWAQCGSGSPNARVTGSTGAYVATRGSTTVYSGPDYRAAIQAAVDSISSGQRVSVIASGSIGANTISITSGKTFEGCGTINVANRSGRGAIEVTDASGVQIPFLTMTGNPYFGLRFSGTSGLVLGKINLNLSGGLGIRFDRDLAANTNVKMDTITVTGAGSHAVETWNIDGLVINSVIARNVGECGLLLQNTRNANVGLVDGQNVATGTGYATLRFANQNGRRADGTYGTNVYIDKVVSRGGGRGVFCVSESGGAQINNLDVANSGSNALLIENCYNVQVRGGTVNGGGEVRLAARTEFANNRDISLTLRVDNNVVRESPCGENTNFSITGNAQVDVC